MIDVKISPLLGSILESFGEKSGKTCLTEFSGVWAYTPFFKQKLKAALQELAAVDFLADWRIDADDVVHVLRKKPPDGSSKPLPEA